MIVFLYHVTIILHFTDGLEINFSFFLHQILYKVAKGLQSASKKAETSLCHHSLIKKVVV